MIDFRKLVSSFRYASAGLIHAVRTQQNARLQLAAAVAVVTAGFLFHISSVEWLAVILAGGLVFTMEVMNTALEVICDRVCTEHDAAIGLAKDVAAAAVLVSAITSGLVGAVVFLPKIAMLLGQ